MMTINRSLIFLVLMCTGFVQAVYAAAPRQLEWKDLVPKISPDHPFAKLTRYQAMQLNDIADVRERLARGEKVGAIELADEKAASKKLEEAGVDAIHEELGMANLGFAHDGEWPAQRNKIGDLDRVAGSCSERHQPDEG